MANDKKFVVKNGLTAQNISFVDDTQSTNNTITVSMLGTDTLSFSGDSGQLFSITDTLSGTIFAVNDISGVPSIEVDDDGAIRGAVTVMSDSVNTNSWNNVVLTWNGSAGNYYFNNQQGSLNAGTAGLHSYTNFFIGSNPGTQTNHYYEGSISNTKIYNRALSQLEVSQNFNAMRNRFGI